MVRVIVVRAVQQQVVASLARVAVARKRARVILDAIALHKLCAQIFNVDLERERTANLKLACAAARSPANARTSTCQTAAALCRSSTLCRPDRARVAAKCAFVHLAVASERKAMRQRARLGSVDVAVHFCETWIIAVRGRNPITLSE